jgi:hypothetical protein
VAERFAAPAVQKSLEVDLTLIATYDRLLTDLELDLVQTAKAHEAQTFARLAVHHGHRQNPRPRAPRGNP